MPERAAQLYAAAVALFVERGYHDVGVDDIVARCGLSHGTFYGYFRNKRDLLQSLMDRTDDDLATVVVGSTDWAGLVDRDAYVAEFRAMITRVLQHFSDRAQVLSFVLLSASGVDAAAYARFAAGYRRISNQVRDILAVAAARGWMYYADEVNMAWAGEIVISCVTATALPLLLDSGEQVDVAETARLCADYLLGGTCAVVPPA